MENFFKLFFQDNSTVFKLEIRFYSNKNIYQNEYSNKKQIFEFIFS